MSLAALSAHAQNTTIADMQQDFALIKREVGNLRLEVEQLRRENADLKRQINSVDGGADAAKLQVGSAKAEMAAQMEAMRKDIIAQVKREMESMAKQTTNNMEKLAQAIDSRPQAALPTTFSEDYPKNGVTYTVKSGDTLSKIAKNMNSRVKWIQDANRIADVNRGLKVGETIFVPQQ